MIDCFEEVDTSIAIVTETWLSDGHGLDDDVDDLLQGAGLGMLYRNRKANSRGVSHGGVAVLFREGALQLKAVKVHNPGKYEVLMTVGNIKGYTRKIIVIACYLPPNYNVSRGRRAMDFIARCVTKAKRQFDDPFILIGGTSTSGRLRRCWQTLSTSVRRVALAQLGRDVVLTAFSQISTTRSPSREPFPR